MFIRNDVLAGRAIRPLQLFRRVWRPRQTKNDIFNCCKIYEFLIVMKLTFLLNYGKLKASYEGVIPHSILHKCELNQQACRTAGLVLKNETHI